MKRSAVVAFILLITVVSCASTSTFQPQVASAIATVAPTGTPTLPLTSVPTGTLAPRQAPTPLRDASKIRDGIQQSLDLYARAYNNNDENLLAQAVDPAAPFWRFVTTRFANYQKSSVAGQGNFGYTVQDIQPRDFGFAQARIRSRGGGEAYWLFHEHDGKWVLAEPSAEQMGEPRTIEHAGFVFKTYAWADDTNEQVIQLMDNARARVLKVLGKVPDEKATVTIKPVYAVSPYDDPFAVAYYSGGSRGDQISIFSPHSYGYGGYDSVVGWQGDLETILTHEYTHMMHNRSFGYMGRRCDWTVEGLAQFTAGEFHRDMVRAAVRSGNIIPLVDNAEPVYKQDLNHLATLKKDRSLAYGYAVSLVSFIAENYGGLDGFWKVARACDSTVDSDAVFQQSLGITFEKFDQDWRNWLKKY